MAEDIAVAPADEAASETDARLVRGVRRRLVAWSGGSTLVVLLALGIALYAAVANTLAGASVGQLEARTGPWVAALQGQPGSGQPPPGFGFQPGRGNTFLFAFDSEGKPVQLGREPVVVLSGMPEPGGLDAARGAADGRNVWAGQLDIQSATIPVRILTQRVTYREDGQTYFLQALQDRSTEVDTLNALVTVLLVGGLVVVLVAVGFGAIYARRALVPIRESLAGQRASLQRQREFAADASHELRTPLTVIRASVEHLRRNAERPVAEVGDALVDIDAEVEHLTGLVDDLLLLARSDSGAAALERVPLHLDDVAADAAASLAQPAAAAGVRVEVDPEPTAAVGDPARLRQLVTILVDNAIRHSPHGSAVRVIVRPDGSDATVAVEDAGPGVAPEDRPRVFDRFWRAPGAPAGGTGLGLAIAKWIAEHHDGSISVDRSAAGGARFEVRIPGPPVPIPAPEAAS
ncbi:MAG TPA: HAMP domain-containing sensor histidine kinase [Candidatus Limnocylindrales bacterium]|jgi:signal transduction histidine kinase